MIDFTLRTIYKVVDKVKSILDSSNVTHPVILLEGEMGAGKTTFTHYFVKSYNPSALVNSPTYTIINEYDCNDFSVYHFDLFRVKDPLELDELGLEEIWSKKGISIIEWWKIAKSYIHIPGVIVKLEALSPKKRRAYIETYQYDHPLL